MLTTIGLTLIAIAWILQFSSVLQGNREIKRFFVVFYALGVLLLVIDGYMNKLTTMASLNLITLLLSGFVVFKLKKGE
jgi:hypothetical protein